MNPEIPTVRSLPRRRALAAMTALAAAPMAARAAIAPGDEPDFTLARLDGPPLRLQEQRGQVVLVNFWATWCGPCRQEMPHLNRLHERLAPAGLVLLGLNIDDDRSKAATLARSLGLRFPVLFDPERRVARAWDIASMPTTVLIGRDGRVRHVHRGYRDGLETTYDAQARSLLTA